MDKRLSLANNFFLHAVKEFKEYEENGDEILLRQSCEKGWGAVAQALKVVNPKIRRHAEFGRTAAELAEKYNNEEIVHGEAFGELLHREGFYEGDMDKKTVEHGLRCIESFLLLINGILNGKEKS
ncbi:MAG: PaREP1 family protein [bacterium]